MVLLIPDLYRYAQSTHLVQNQIYSILESLLHAVVIPMGAQWYYSFGLGAFLQFLTCLWILDLERRQSLHPRLPPTTSRETERERVWICPERFMSLVLGRPHISTEQSEALTLSRMQKKKSRNHWSMKAKTLCFKVVKNMSWLKCALFLSLPACVCMLVCMCVLHCMP